jgi:hypothetical protein
METIRTLWWHLKRFIAIILHQAVKLSLPLNDAIRKSIKLDQVLLVVSRSCYGAIASPGVMAKYHQIVTSICLSRIDEVGPGELGRGEEEEEGGIDEG